LKGLMIASIFFTVGSPQFAGHHRHSRRKSATE